MTSKIKQNILAELQEAYDNLPESSMKSKLLEGLINSVAKLDDDKAIVNTIWANKDLPLRMFTTDELKLMPSFNTLLIGEPYKDKIDLDKAFGKDWYKNTAEIPYNKIALVAAKEGRSPNTVLNEMSEEATKRNRYDIAHEGVLGTLMPLFAKRTQEAIERGESPSGTDVGLDLGETALQAVPYGRAAGFIGNKAGKFLVSRLLSNATAPVLTEAADAAVYDSTNARGNFDWRDVAAGAGTNVMGESFLKLGGGFLNRIGADKTGKKLMNLGEGETLTQSLAKDLKDVNKLESRNSLLMNRNAKGEALSTNTAGSNHQRIDAINYEKNRDALENRKQILEEIDFRYNGNKARDKVYGKGNHSTVPDNLRGFENDWQPDEFGALTDEQLKTMANDPMLQKYINVDKNIWPKESQYMKEEAVKNLITNKLGGYQQEQGKAFTRIPFGLGARLQKVYDDRIAEEERRKAEEDILNEYRIDLFGGK